MSRRLVLSIFMIAAVPVYTFNDVVRDIVPDRDGYEAMIELAGVMDRTSVKVTSNPETEEFATFLKKTLGQFDFMNLYRSRYCKELPEGFCGVRIQGCGGGDREYSVTLVTSPDNQCPMKHIWDFSTEYALKRNEHNAAGGQSFIVSVASTTATKRFSHRNAMAFAEGMLKVLDPENIGSLNAPKSELFRSIEGEPRNVVDDFVRSFPKISELFNRYVSVRSLAQIKSYNGVPYTHLDVRYGYRMENLTADFPRLARSLDDIKGLYRITMDVKNESGNTLMYLVFDSREEVFSLSLYTRQGKLVPRDSANNPVFSEEFSPKSLRDYSYRAVLAMVHNVHGLLFTTPAATIGFTYHSSSEGGVWRMKLEDVSRTAISGSYYHIIPPWLINAFIPVNMEQFIYDFSRVLIEGNGGKGSGVSFEWDTRDPGNVMLSFDAIGEFIDNQFLRFGLKVWGKKTMGDKKLGDEARALRERLITAFMADLRTGKP